MSTLRWAALSDTGRVREHNQDRIHTDVPHGVFVLADGMGGTAAGEDAAQITTALVPRLLSRTLSSDPADTLAADTEHQLRDALAEVSTEVHEAGNRSLRRAGMGSTVVAAVIASGQVTIGHLGDSRAYLLHQGRFQQLTRDHTLAQLLVQSGELTAEQAAAHSRLRKLTRYVGMREHPEPDVATFAFTASDRLLLCSDGLTGMLDDADIAAILTEHDPAQACHALITAANAAGGTDNITVIVVHRTDEPPVSGHSAVSKDVAS